MTLKRLRACGGFHIPDIDGVVARPRNGLPAIARDRHRVNLPVVVEWLRTRTPTGFDNWLENDLGQLVNSPRIIESRGPQRRADIKA
jgi:hypothetical protein